MLRQATAHNIETAVRELSVRKAHVAFSNYFFRIKVKRITLCKIQKTELAEYSIPIILLSGFARNAHYVKTRQLPLSIMFPLPKNFQKE